MTHIESFKTECSLPGRRRGKRQVAADLQEGKHPYCKLSMEAMQKVTQEEHLGAESQQWNGDSNEMGTTLQLKGTEFGQ